MEKWLHYYRMGGEYIISIYQLKGSNADAITEQTTKNEVILMLFNFF